MSYKDGETNKYKDIMDKIAGHGSEEVEIINPKWCTKDQVIKRERILIVLEMLFNKATEDGGNLGAAQQYLDRMLGKPKESLKLTNGSELLSKLSDEEIVGNIVRIFKAAGEGKAGKAD